MAQTTEMGLGKMTYAEAEEAPKGEVLRPRNKNGMKKWKKVLLLSLAAVALIALVGGGIAWTKRGVVTVQTGKVMRQDLTAIVTASGEIKPKKENQANVNANSTGKIVEILVKEGDRVKKGQVLLRLEAVQPGLYVEGQSAVVRSGEAAIVEAEASLKKEQANLQEKRADLRRAQLNWERAEGLYTGALVSRQEFDTRKAEYEKAQASVESAQAKVGEEGAKVEKERFNLLTARTLLAGLTDQLQKTAYTSPLDGIVTSLPVHIGENVVPGIQNQPGSLLYQVSDLSVITAEVKVDETDIVNVKLGHQAEVTIDAFPNKTFKGHVAEIGQSAVGRTSGLTSGQTSASSEEAKDFKVVVTLDEPPPNLRPGLSATAKITTAARKNVVTIPIQALTIRQRRELEEPPKDTQGKALAATQPPAASSATGKDKSKEELQGIFVVRGGSAVFATVETGIMGTTDVEILNGLQPGEEIVTGSYKVLRTLKNKTKVKVDNRPAAAAGSGPGPS